MNVISSRGMVPSGAVEGFERALLELNRQRAGEVIDELRSMFSPIEIAEKLVAPALERIGECWSEGSLALSQVYMAGRICEDLVDTILPPAAPQRKDQPPIAIAVLEDYHMLGKRIVYAAVRSAGFELLNYGRVTAVDLVNRVRQDRVRVVLISVLMYPSALLIKQVCKELDDLTPEVRVLVGGAPFNLDPQLWREVGADAMARNAGEAVKLITAWLQELQ